MFGGGLPGEIPEGLKKVPESFEEGKGKANKKVSGSDPGHGQCVIKRGKRSARVKRKKVVPKIVESGSLLGVFFSGVGGSEADPEGEHDTSETPSRRFPDCAASCHWVVCVCVPESRNSLRLVPCSGASRYFKNFKGL